MQLWILSSVPLAFMILTTAVILNFVSERREIAIKKYQKTPVDTLTMYLAIGLMYVSFRMSYMPKFGFLKIEMPFFLQLFGMVLVYFSLFVNVAGRLTMKGQWSNMIKIKENHQVIDTGVFGWVRHPLYASTIWMIFGAALIYGNIGIFVILVVVFYPMMVYRAKQEEALLSELLGYPDYKARTGRFFPKLWR